MLWDTIEGWAARTITPHKDGSLTAAVLSVEYSKAGNLVTAGRDKSVRLMNGSGSIKGRLDGFDDLPMQVAFSHDGQLVLAGDFDGQVKVWNPEQKEGRGDVGAVRGV